MTLLLPCDQQFDEDNVLDCCNRVSIFYIEIFFLSYILSTTLLIEVEDDAAAVAVAAVSIVRSMAQIYLFK